MHNRSPPQRNMGAAASVCLALQGGGALGAFTWGVLEALLQREIPIEAASGASAGAVNAVVLADGLAEGGPEQALRKLATFWRRTSQAYSLGGAPAWAALATFDFLSAQPSPILTNPLGLNPLRDVLRDTVDFERLRHASPVRLFVSATRVRDGRARIFPTEELTLEAVLASACLPQFHDAVEIDGEAYWDGGYSANPPILELVRGSQSPELLVVELTSGSYADLPPAGRMIEQRLRGFALGASLERELDTLAELQRLIEDDPAAKSQIAHRLRGLKVRRISAQAYAPDASALDSSWNALRRLADGGAAAAERWILERP
jgi:NTE family protein